MPFQIVPRRLLIPPSGLLSEKSVISKERVQEAQGTVINESVREIFVNNFLLIEGSIVATFNQSGGQAAHSIINIHAPQVPPKAMPQLIPVVECLLVRADNQIGLDFYDFRVRLRNDGDSTAREFRLEVEIPNEFKPPGTGGAVCEIHNHNRGALRLFRVTDKDRPGLVLYPHGDVTADYVVLLDFQIAVSRYVTITRDEVIRVKTYAEDSPPVTTDFRVADYLSEDRCNQLWARNDARPEALRHPREFHSPR